MGQLVTLAAMKSHKTTDNHTTYDSVDLALSTVRALVKRGLIHLETQGLIDTTDSVDGGDSTDTVEGGGEGTDSGWESMTLTYFINGLYEAHEISESVIKNILQADSQSVQPSILTLWRALLFEVTTYTHLISFIFLVNVI